MKRRTFDKIVTQAGVGLAVFLFIAAGLLNWGYTFADSQVRGQLSAQSITLPSETQNSKESADVTAFFKENGNKPMTTGKQAQMYADHYLGFHLSKLPTYASASGANRTASAALQADPTNVDLQAKAKAASGTLETVFKGTMLRGTLLTAYAFWELGQIARIAAGVTIVGGILLLILSIAGWVHLRRTPEDATI